MEQRNNTDPAKQAIKAYLDNRAQTDEQFAQSYAKPKKNIDECFNYILSEARKRGNQVCMTDEEVFGLAVHYYDEDNIKVEKQTGYRASTSAKVELTEEEKAEAKERAMANYERACIEEMKRVEKEKAKKKEQERKAQIELLKKAEQEDNLFAAMAL